LSKGLAFRLIESLGIVPRSDIINELKDMDQDSRALLRKHGVRFGQFNIFLPKLLKPAVTRMRLVLWSLKRNFDEFPSAPTAGLVTINANNNEADGYFIKAGYHFTGDWALRIDMLERLADLIRKENTRAGFEASSDMLSITGMTNEQFSSLMAGLGYDVKKGEREKEKKLVSEEGTQEVVENIVETFWSFTWKNKKTNNKTLDKPNLSENQNKPKKIKNNYSNKKNRNKNQINKDTPPDPNNPFAVLLALKES
jgi:ATP-dependent RNA helicase SUPV3L1/SUV3